MHRNSGPQTGNLFVLISSVEFQRGDAFTWFQKFLGMTRQTDIKSQNACGLSDGRTYYTVTQAI